MANSVATQPTTTYSTQPVYAIGPDGQYTATGETQQVAQQGTELKPFQTYGGEFVAPVNQEQSAGIAGTNAAANQAQPYFGAATGTLGQAQAGANSVNQAAESGTAANAAPLTGQDINRYLSPYLGDVLGSTSALLNQNNQQQQAGQLGSAIRSGAFGGDRTGIAAANLEQQQNLANANIYSGIANQGYQSALGTAQGQQQIGLAGAKQLADIGQTAYGEGANTATTLAGLGSGAQSAALQGAQAQIGAGTVQQQTQQAQDTAQYQQFLQQQSYPFQVAQFLANIAEGTGALSGSTTTTQQPGGFFSDERLKEDMEPIGKTFDGQPIYRYRMKGDHREQIGLSAQQVEKRHPEAVGVAGGYRWVDYGKATEDAANRGKFYTGGVTRASLHERRAYAYGGGPDDSNGGLGAVLAAQQGMYSNRGSEQQRNIPTGGASHQLAVAQGTPAPPPSGGNKVSQTIGLGKDAYQGYKWLNKPSPTAPASHGVAGPGSQTTTYTPGLNSMPDAAVPQQPGVTTSFDASPGTTTTFDAAPVSNSAGLGAADTAAPAAADTAATNAAATGATEAAASGAAESAATGAAAEGAAGAAAGTAAGAATGAVAAGAADAAATEAAALAAEYAATYAAMAAVAAKRGGRINRRGKFAAGGTPYETTYELNIPDQEQSGEHLQSPGPLVKQPTGLQTAMKMGDPNQWEGLASSMSSNTALATGGVAGRRGYDDGGAPEQDSDPGDVAPATDSAPQIASDSDRGAGVVGAAKHPWLEKVKKSATAENVIPLLTGLAAMGTAPTRSAGVALAAGLGAGAQSYLGTRRSLAQTSQEQAKTRGIDIENQMSNLKLGVAKDAFNPQSTATIPRAPIDSASAPSSDAEQTAGGLAAQYRHQLFVNKARTPEEQAAKDAAIKKDWAVGGNMFASQADNDYQARVERDLQNSRNKAQLMADARYQQFNNAKTPGEKQVALAHYNALRQWTGDETGIEGGIVKNSRTKQPEIGTIAQQGFTPAEESKFMDMALAPTDVRNPDTGQITTMEAWKAHGAASPKAYANSLKVNSTVQGSGSGVPASRTTTPVIPADYASSPAPSAGAGVIGTSQSPVAQRQQALDQEAVAHVREAGDAAPNNRNINQQLLQLSAETATGPATAAVQKIAGALGLPSGSRYQEINAYLDRQAASQALAMGVPHTNAGLAASQTATGTTEYTPQALQEKVKYADALNSGTLAYREGLDKAVGTGATPNLQKYQAFRSAWAKNFDPDVFRADDALRRGDSVELNAIRVRLGPKGMKALAQKSANLRALENGQIPP